MLSESDKRALLKLSRDSLASAFVEKDPGVLAAFVKEHSGSPLCEQSLPCFVTLFAQNERLRGCIGCVVSSRSLPEEVAHYTQLAAFEDPRFPPVKPHEVEGLVIHLSLLGPQQSFTDFEAIKIGTHGLKVRAGQKQGLLLADVATRYGWTPEEFRTQTCLKAGLDPEGWASYEWHRFEEVSFGEDDFAG